MVAANSVKGEGLLREAGHTCRRRWQRRSRGVRAARDWSVSEGQFFRLSVRSDVLRAMAAQPASETMLAFCRLRQVRCAIPVQPANPSPA